MIDHSANRLALRSLALTLSVATTGSTTLSATATGYARASGSFITDGFVAGMEAVPAGFPQTTPGLIDNVTATTMTIRGGRTVATANSGRSLSVGLPAIRFFGNRKPRENGVEIDSPKQGRWFVEEDYVPGPTRKVTLGALGEVEAFPSYFVKLYCPENTGTLAMDALTAALLDLYAPTTSLSVTAGDSLTVRTDPAPSLSQLLPGPPGWAFQSVQVPCRARSRNLI